MRSRRVVSSRMLALVLPAMLGLACVERDWNLCSPQDECHKGYTCTADWKCVREVDGGADALAAVDSQAAETAAAAVDGPVSDKDGPADAATPDAATPDTATPDAATPDTATPDVSVADAAPTCPTDKRDCSGTCIDQTGCCQASDCSGTCKTCVAHACVAVISQDSPTCAGTCDSTGTCTSKKGQLCTAVPGGCAAGTKCSPEGMCCDRTCSGSCEACDLAGSLGTCTTLPSGATPHSGHSACGGTGVCAGSCGGSIDGSCTYPTGPCGSASCTGLSYQAAGTCNAGTCAAPAAQTCLYACSTTAGCTGECTPNATRCNAGTAQICSASYTWQDITPNPCQNGGSCVSGTSGYTCSCTGGWAGANCTMMFKYLPLPAGCTAATDGGWAFGISGDGATVVGTVSCDSFGGDRAWIWTASGGTMALSSSGCSTAAGINYDGSIVAGDDGLSCGERTAAKWTGSGFQLTALPSNTLDSFAAAASSNGTVVGRDGRTAVRWALLGSQRQAVLDSSISQSEAIAVSRYDEAIVGTYWDGTKTRGFRKSSSGGVIPLDCATGIVPTVYGISVDGKVVVGSCDTDAVSWDASGNRTSLGFQDYAAAANQDGSVIAGGEGSISQVFIWTAAKGARDMATVLAGAPGLPSSSDWLQSSGISADGRVITGHIILGGVGGVDRAWIAYLP